MSRYLYDITNPNVAYNWLYEALKMKQGDLIDAYCLECHKDVNAFYEKYRIVMDSIDIEKLEIAAFHVTTCVDDCNEIKLYGLHIEWFDASIDEERKTDILLKYTINALAYSEMRIRPFLPMYNPIIFLKRDYDVSKECIRKIWRFKREGSKLVPTDES